MVVQRSSTPLVNGRIKKRVGRHAASKEADKKRRLERRKNAMSMRIAGATMQEIVNAGIGYNNTSMVAQDLKRAQADFYQEDIESLLILDLARIDEMQKICTLVMRSQQDTSQVRNIMALMQFRRETMGYKPEDIADRRTSAGAVTNNGIMVVQGNTRDFLKGVMEAAGATPEVMEHELRELENTSQNSSRNTSAKTNGSPEVSMNARANAGAHVITHAQTQAHAGARVIPGEVIQEVIRETGATGQEVKKKTGKRFKLVRKENTQPGPGEPTEPSHSAQQASRVSQVALGDSILLGELVEARARKLEEDIEARHQPGMGSLDDPAVVPRELAIPVKLPDTNVPVSPGVVYRNPPRKLSQEEGRRVVLRKVKNSHTDILKTQVHEEEI